MNLKGALNYCLVRVLLRDKVHFASKLGLMPRRKNQRKPAHSYSIKMKIMN